LSSKAKVLTFLYSSLYFIVLLVALKICDVAEIGHGNTKIGLSNLNSWYRNAFNFYGAKGYSETLFTLTELLFYVCIAVCIFFFALMIRDMVKAGRIDGVGVDKNLLASSFLYLVTLVILLIFKALPVNLRPVLLTFQKSLESSFPSSRVTVYIISLGSVIFHTWDYYSENRKRAKIITIVCSVLLAFGIIARMLSGVCWFTDIIGGILLGVALLILYSVFFDV